MLEHYLALDLPVSATDDEIRRRYLELVRAHPPSHDPERFQRVSNAFEALKDLRSRIDTDLFGTGAYEDFEMAIEALAHARMTRRRAPGLDELAAAEGILHG